MNREISLMALANRKLGHIDIKDKLPLLTNYYPVNVNKVYIKEPIPGAINIGCFGAFRQLKNHLTQAVAAIEFAEQHNFKLNFHVNAGRIEKNGSNPYKNLRALFSNLPQYNFIEHPWTSHENFIKIINCMDICMQVSFSETFNIVSADAAVCCVPLVVSEEIV
jgi:hypothetical protein